MQKASRPCREPGCVRYAVRRESYCEAHLRPRGRSAKASAWRKEYGTSRWTKARAAFLQLHPLCAACEAEGRLVPAMVVDHVTPHRGDLRLFWDSGNWQALCKPCHDRKTAAEDGGFGNVRLGPGAPALPGEGGQIPATVRF